MENDKRVYALYIVQVYHYTYHACNLGFAGTNLANTDTRLMHHFFKYAMEETGRVPMALNDLRALGIPINDVL